MPETEKIREKLEYYAQRYNQPAFIATDPIRIPRQFEKLQDIEIVGLWIAILAWGQRKTILNKGQELVDLMGGQPHEFMLNHREKDRERFLSFKHRTFQAIDTLYFLEFFQWYYRRHASLESAFADALSPRDEHVGPALLAFHRLFFSLPDAPQRTRKHLPSPERKSTCKRLNMFLRWMVRRDERGVDFGCWTRIRPDQLLMPLDVHVDRVARAMGLIERKATDWLTVLELTRRLKAFDPQDPVRYDFALFGLGVLGKDPI